MVLMGWCGPFKEEVLNIIIYGQATGAVCVVPGEVNYQQIGTGPVLVEFIVLEEDVVKVVGVAFANVFDAEVIDN